MDTRNTLDLLREYESRNVTFIAEDGSWPIVWEQARGVHVLDADGKRYLDLTGAFGVAAAGHANRAVVQAGQRQMRRLLHAMGDVHPHAGKALLARKLSAITFERWAGGRVRAGTNEQQNRLEGASERYGFSSRIHGKTIFCNSGFEAVEAALKTAILATGKPGIIAFEGAYHGLGYGALNATHREHFSSPFIVQLKRFGTFVPFPRKSTDAGANKAALTALENRLGAVFAKTPVGAILVEPIQVRGGINIPPPGFLNLLRHVCDDHSALLILDEIYTGFGRTGKWFACEHDRVMPDIICLGKALTGGFPLSACVGDAEIMDRAWPLSTGEAIHTSTFLGHPVGCAMALAQLEEIERLGLVERSARLGAFLVDELRQSFEADGLGDRAAARARGWRGSASAGNKTRQVCYEARGLGLLAGLELRYGDGSPATSLALKAIQEMLSRGFILLPEGEHSNIISLTPPLIISRKQLWDTVKALAGAAILPMNR